MSSVKRLGCNKDMRRFLEHLETLGCIIEANGTGHILITTPLGDHYSCPMTPKSPEIAVKKLRTIERRVRAASPPRTPPRSLNPSGG